MLGCVLCVAGHSIGAVLRENGSLTVLLACLGEIETFKIEDRLLYSLLLRTCNQFVFVALFSVVLRVARY